MTSWNACTSTSTQPASPASLSTSSLLWLTVRLSFPRFLQSGMSVFFSLSSILIQYIEAVRLEILFFSSYYYETLVCCFSVFYDVKIVLMKAKSVALLEFRRIIQGRKGERERFHLTSTFQISNRNICSLTCYPLPVKKEN